MTAKTAKTLAGAGRKRPTPQDHARLKREIRVLEKEIESLEHMSDETRLALIEAREDAKKWRDRAELQTQQIAFWLDRLTIALTDWQKKGPKP